MDDTNAMITAIQTVIADPKYASDWWQGLVLGVTVMCGCLGFSMLRTTSPDTEDM